MKSPVSIMHLPDGVDPAEAPLKRRSASQNTASRPEAPGAAHVRLWTSPATLMGIATSRSRPHLTDLTAQYTKRTV